MATLTELNGTKWAGAAELWLDPLGDEVVRSECTICLNEQVVRYTWSHQGANHTGSITLNDEGAEFEDSWHSPEPMRCRPIASAWGLFQVQGEYGPALDWRWRMGLSLRAPSGELILQMTNVAPWGEEARAVRMICKRQ